MAKNNIGSPDQPLSGKDYVLIALVLLIIGAGFLWAFVHFAPQLISNGISDQFYYTVLLVFGLICATVLFGVLTGYATVTLKKAGWLVRLGGPVAAAFLVVCGGLWAVPRPQSFSVVIRASCARPARN